MRVDDPDEIVDIFPETCTCEESLAGRPSERYVSWQIHDVPIKMGAGRSERSARTNADAVVAARACRRSFRRRPPWRSITDLATAGTSTARRHLVHDAGADLSDLEGSARHAGLGCGDTEHASAGGEEMGSRMQALRWANRLERIRQVCRRDGLSGRGRDRSAARECTEAMTAFRISGSRKHLLSSMAGSLVHDVFVSYPVTGISDTPSAEAHPALPASRKWSMKAKALFSLMQLVKREADDAHA